MNDQPNDQPNDTTPFPPPPPSDSRGPGDPDTTRLRHPVALFAAAASISIAAAVAAGTVIGLVAASSGRSNCSPTDGWCELGASLVALAVGIIAGGFTYIAAGVVTITKFRSKGNRAGFVAAHLALPPILVLAGSVLAAIGDALR